MESFQKLIEWLLNIGVNWPDMTAISVGTVSGWSIATVIEFLMSGIGLRQLFVKKVMVVSTILFSWVFSVVLWIELDPADPLKTVVIVCGALAPISPLSYVVVARTASKYVPWINSLWAVTEETKRGDKAIGPDAGRNDPA